MNSDFSELNAYFEEQEKKEKQAVLDKIKKVQERLANKDKAIEELQYERDLIFGNLRAIICNDLRMSYFNIFRGFNDDIFWKAWRWSNHKDTVDEELKKGDLDENEYKSHKTAFDVTVHTIKDKFFGKDLKDKIKFKEIIKSWTTGYDYHFTYKKQEVKIFIPLFHADDRDWAYALGGYCVNYKESDCCWAWIAGSLEYTEVAEKLQDWLINERWKEKK